MKRNDGDSPLISRSGSEDGPYGTFDPPEGGAPGSQDSPKGVLGKVNKAMQSELSSVFLVEFIATFLFVFVGGLSLQSGQLIVAASAHGFAIALLIAAIAHISGGHINPAVTLGVAISGGVPWKRTPIYWIAQFLGAFLAGGFIRASVTADTYYGINGGCLPIPLLGERTTVGQAVILEAIITFTLVFTVILTAVDRNDNVLAPLAIGFAVFVGILAAGADDGASMNPARSFGPLLMYTMIGNHGECELEHGCYTPKNIWKTHWAHWVGPIIGCVLAGIVYRFFLAKRKREE